MSNKLGLIGGWWRVCASGFGLGVDAARAVGIVVFILSIIFVVGIAIIWWIVKFFINRNKEKKAAEAAAQSAAEPAAQPAAQPVTEDAPEAEVKVKAEDEAV
ncbi:MAG: hypothetical protein E7131_00670 [Rikenellaceae bacterium]|nr:hypothetical protein [Rikenellaceae bacterium]